MAELGLRKHLKTCHPVQVTKARVLREDLCSWGGSLGVSPPQHGPSCCTGILAHLGLSSLLLQGRPCVGPPISEASHSALPVPCGFLILLNSSKLQTHPWLEMGAQFPLPLK